jgi:hypothetical protein
LIQKTLGTIALERLMKEIRNWWLLDISTDGIVAAPLGEVLDCSCRRKRKKM